MPYTCLLHGAGEDILTVPTYYRLRAMTVDGNGRSGFTHIDIPLLQDDPKSALSANQAGTVKDCASSTATVVPTTRTRCAGSKWP